MVLKEPGYKSEAMETLYAALAQSFHFFKGLKQEKCTFQKK
jgi:hypothetical protein